MRNKEKQFLEAVARDLDENCTSIADIDDMKVLYDKDGEILCNVLISADVHDYSTIEMCSTDRGNMPVGVTNIEYKVHIHSMPDDFLPIKDEMIRLIEDRMEEIYEN